VQARPVHDDEAADRRRGSHRVALV
jgi:hypothetical protein